VGGHYALRNPCEYFERSVGTPTRRSTRSQAAAHGLERIAREASRGVHRSAEGAAGYGQYVPIMHMAQSLFGQLVQLVSHMKPPHRAPPVQGLLQAPQLLQSLAMFTHRPPQNICPAMQDAPSGGDDVSAESSDTSAGGTASGVVESLPSSGTSASACDASSASRSTSAPGASR
jgi:hypothetical protein